MCTLTKKSNILLKTFTTPMVVSALNPFSTKQSPATSAKTDPALRMQAALQAVALIRQQRRENAALDASVAWVKQFQTLRFRHCYADMLSSSVYGGVARFFLERLYAQAQPQHLDDQFARIAPSIAKVFPGRVVETAVEVGQLHLLTETLDQAMGDAITQQQKPGALPNVSSNEALACYVAVWREVAHAADRNRQLEMVLDLGNTMAGLVKIPGLALGLKLMRGPAQLAHLGDLQNWLEEGFVTFAALDRRAGATESFLRTVEHRESDLIDTLFNRSFEVATRTIGMIMRDGAP
jgi:hypothetical protein